MKRLFTLILMCCTFLGIEAQVPCDGDCFFGILEEETFGGCSVKVSLENEIPGSSCSVAGQGEVDWGDGTTSPESNNMNHTYASNGTYTICLKLPFFKTVDEIECEEFFCTDVVIEGCEPEPCDGSCWGGGVLVAEELDNCSVSVSLEDDFPGSSCDFDGSAWINWGDGTASTSQSFGGSHTFTYDGTYNVCLIVPFIVRNSEEECAEFWCTDVVIEGCGPEPCSDCFVDALWYETSGADDCYVNMYFGNYDTGTFCDINGLGRVEWGDGDSSPVTSLSSPNFNHNYENPGIYNVCITIPTTNDQGIECVNTYCSEVVITECGWECSDCYVGGSFWLTGTSGCRANFYFGNYDPSTVCPFGSDVFVDFGDGNSTAATNLQTPNFPHTYPCDDTYTACITFTVLASDGEVCLIQECATVDISKCGQCKWGETTGFDEADISVYPTIIGTADHFNLTLDSGNAQEVKVYLFNLDGKMVQEDIFPVSSGLRNLRITPNQLPSGQYIMQIVRDAETTNAGKVLIMD